MKGRLVGRSVAPILMCTLLALGANCGGDSKAPPEVAPPVATITPAIVSLSLSEYLVVTLGITADFGRAGADILQQLPDPLTEPEAYETAIDGFQQAYSGITDDALEALSSITPPPEARSYHNRLRTALEALDRVLGNVLQAEETSALSEATGEVLAVLGGFGALGEEEQRLVVDALGDAEPNPLNEYLIDAVEQRGAFSGQFADYASRLQGTLSSLVSAEDLDELLSLVEELVELLKDFEEEWRQLNPPPDARVIHQRQAELLAMTIELESNLLSALRSEDAEQLLEAAQGVLTLAPQGSRLSADWNDFIALALSR